MTQDLNNVACYGQHMLNPFHGVVNVVEIDGADALTRDGAEWILYLHGREDVEDLEGDTRCVFQTPDIKFGSWSGHSGLKRAPVRSVVDYEEMDARGHQLLDVVKEHAPLVPFQLRDRYELWLLEEGCHRPLALLDSACEPPHVPETIPPRRPGERCKQDFASRRLIASAGVRDSTAGSCHAELLGQRVNAAAGPRPAA